MSETAERIMRYWPLAVAIVTVSLAIGAGQFQLNSVAAETVQNADDIRINTDSISDLERAQIERRGDIRLQLERLRIEQQSRGTDLDKQSQKLDEIERLLLRLLQESPGTNR